MHPKQSLGKVCTLFGITRQAYYEAEIHERKTSIAHMIVLTLIKDLRDEIQLIGTRKLLFLLEPHLEEHGIKMDRDQLFDLLRFHGLLIRRRKRLVKTTDSHHRLKKYPNLMVVTAHNNLYAIYLSNYLILINSVIFKISRMRFLPELKL
jgi:putative transposase